MRPVHGCFVDLYWIPVAAGINSRLRTWSLACWEATSAALARRPRAALYHTALKLRPAGGETHTLELTPVFIGEPVPPLMTGPVGLPAAGRLRLFRYQLRCLQAEAFPDEEHAVASPIRLSTDSDAVQRVLALAAQIPPHTWGLRVRGTTEMWTSNSSISWLLVRAGLEVDALAPPVGGRAPGWKAGLELAGTLPAPVESPVGAAQH